jgi:hypothetical protein
MVVMMAAVSKQQVPACIRQKKGESSTRVLQHSDVCLATTETLPCHVRKPLRTSNTNELELSYLQETIKAKILLPN